MRSLMLALTLSGCQPAHPPAPDAIIPTAAVSALPSAEPAPASAIVAYASTVTVGSRTIPVEVADTPASREQGLSGRASLAEDTGMVLAWPMPTLASIWMPDMNFPLDVIFVRDGKAIALYENVQPCASEAECPTFGPKQGVNYVLEVPAGSAKRWGLKVGDAMALRAGRPAEPDSN